MYTKERDCDGITSLYTESIWKIGGEKYSNDIPIWVERNNRAYDQYAESMGY